MSEGTIANLNLALVDANVPGQLVELTRRYIDSPLGFLLAINVFLLIVGLMDIFSAILVVVPLGAESRIHPVHLGIIFIANPELGYITPPVGLNLLLASYRFDRPVFEVYRASAAFLLILGGGSCSSPTCRGSRRRCCHWWSERRGEAGAGSMRN